MLLIFNCLLEKANCMEVTYKKEDGSISIYEIYLLKKVYKELIKHGYLSKH